MRPARFSLAARPRDQRRPQFRNGAIRGFATQEDGRFPHGESAEIVIVGGGAIGCGIAFTLANEGKTNVLVLEKEPSVSSVTSAQAAGLVGQVRTDYDRVKLAMWSVATFNKLQEDEEVNPNWRPVGSLRLAETDERVEEFKLMESVCKRAGLDVGFISAAEARKMWPGMSFENAKAILWCPSDGYLQPYDLSMTYKHHARKKGVRFATDCSVQSVGLSPSGHVESVTTNKGKVKCEVLINAAGAHAYHVAKLVGLELPIVPVRHEYFISEPLGKERIRPSMPVLRIPDRTLYVRADVNSILVGGWEPKALSLDPRSYTLQEKTAAIDEDWPVLSNFANLLADRFYPPVNEVGIRRVFSGWPTFTPDGKFIIGRTKRVGGFIMAGGCNAHGVSGSAGIGRHVAEALLSKTPSSYVSSLSPERFLDGSWSWSTATRDAMKVYETYYALK